MMVVPTQQGRVVIPMDWQQEEMHLRKVKPVNDGGETGDGAVSLADPVKARATTFGGTNYDSINPHTDAKNNSWTHRLRILISSTRIGKYTLGSVLLVLFYLVLNIFCLAVTAQRGGVGNIIGRGWGSLAAANTMLLIISATRNSILSFALRWPFDHVVVYHRSM